MFGKARFSYIHRGIEYRIYEWSHEENGVSTARFTGECFYSKEEAAKRVYELNGWKYKQNNE